MERKVKARAHWGNYSRAETVSSAPIRSYTNTYSSGRKKIYWGTIKVEQGKRIGIWDSEGIFRVVEGPKKESAYKSEYIELQHHTAAPEEYMDIEYLNGKKEVQPGPYDLWFDPSKHKKLSVAKKVTVDKNECIIVYYETDEGVKRKIIDGPKLYIPEPKSWIHKFSWKNDETTASFYKLRTTPDTMDIDVEYVRTADDALLNVNLRVFFQIANVKKMIDATQDPISDLSNAVATDVIQAVAKTIFIKFKGTTEAFNDLKTYKETRDMAKRIGYDVNKVVFKGFQAGQALQKMVDEGIARRAQLALEADKDKQHQQMLDFKLEREQARVQRENTLRAEEARHKIELKKMDLALENERLQAKLKQDLEIKELGYQKQLEFLTNLKELGVDVTAYLVSQNEAQAAAKKAKHKK